MNHILFVTNKFPPLSCGVGDYTYKMAKSIVPKGIRVTVLCKSDSIIENQKEVFEKEGIIVYPVVESWDIKGLNNLKDTILLEKVDWISLQFVPFSYESKGLPFNLAKGIKTLFPKTNCHIMFHELWVGMERSASPKSIIHGKVQKHIIKSTINLLKPRVVHTNTELYKFKLKSIGCRSEVLPLFSNISKETPSENKKNDKMVLALFGHIHYGAPVAFFLSELVKYLKKLNKTTEDLEFLFLGNCGDNIEEWIVALKKFNIRYQKTGQISEYEISTYLMSANYGITTTPFILTEKSGTVAAMLQHHLKVICVARPWQVKGFCKNDFWFQHGVQFYEGGNLTEILENKVEICYRDVTNIADILIESLTNNN